MSVDTIIIIAVIGGVVGTGIFWRCKQEELSLRTIDFFALCSVLALIALGFIAWEPESPPAFQDGDLIITEYSSWECSEVRAPVVFLDATVCRDDECHQFPIWRTRELTCADMAWVEQ